MAYTSQTGCRQKATYGEIRKHGESVATCPIIGTRGAMTIVMSEWLVRQMSKMPAHIQQMGGCLLPSEPRWFQNASIILNASFSMRFLVTVRIQGDHDDLAARANQVLCRLVASFGLHLDRRRTEARGFDANLNDVPIGGRTVELKVPDIDRRNMWCVQLTGRINVRFLVNPTNQFPAEQGIPAVQIGGHHHFSRSIYHVDQFPS